jgi:hypothetical protein
MGVRKAEWWVKVVGAWLWKIGSCGEGKGDGERKGVVKFGVFFLGL